jgi:hypothetical protein
MNPRLFVVLLALLGISSSPVVAQATACPQGVMDKTFFRGIVQSNYAPPSNVDEVVNTLMECLASPDSVLRDTYGFEILSRWIRRGVLSPDSLKRMVATLTPNLKIGLGQRSGNATFRRSFSALVLSELIRQDNLAPYLEKPQLLALLGAVRSKVAPAGSTAYAFGEDERLARVVIAVLAGGQLNPTEWAGFVQNILAPAPFSSWNDIWFDASGLAKRHNTKLFLLSLNLYLTVGNAQNAGDLLPSVNSALAQLP